MKKWNIAVLISLSFFAAPNVGAAETEATCSGISTLLFSNNDRDLTICHGEYTKINRSQLSRWQNCDDAMILVRDKKKRKMSLYAECDPIRTKQFMLRGSTFMLRHYYVKHPGFEARPLLIETFDLATNTKKYEFIKKFSACTKKDIDNAFRQINTTIAKPFDGDTFFDAVYGGFYKLRDCSTTEPRQVLTELRKYEKSGRFDGEVAETLSEVIAEVELISTAVNQHK